MEIGKKLKAARSRAGLTQEQVAEHLFVSRQTISNWENEKYSPLISRRIFSEMASPAASSAERLIRYPEASFSMARVLFPVFTPSVLSAFIASKLCAITLMFICPHLTYSIAEFTYI